jgi:hypothetical protein
MNKIAFTLKWRQLHISKWHVSAQGCERMCIIDMLWVTALVMHLFLTTVVIIHCQRVAKNTDP